MLSVPAELLPKANTEPVARLFAQMWRGVRRAAVQPTFVLGNFAPKPPLPS